jgi:hypothetical protein
VIELGAVRHGALAHGVGHRRRGLAVGGGRLVGRDRADGAGARGTRLGFGGGRRLGFGAHGRSVAGPFSVSLYDYTAARRL